MTQHFHHTVSQHLDLEVNSQGRDFVVGDLHGMYKELMQALKRVDFKPSKDRLIAVGDLVDRGPDSLKCLSLLNEPWFYSVLGNHEELMITALLDESDTYYSMWLANGGDWSLTENADELKAWAKRLTHLPLTISFKNPLGTKIGVCHAEYPSSDWSQRTQLNRIESNALIWSRNQVKNRLVRIVSNVDHLFHGHTPVNDPVILGNSQFIDTGCFKTFKLTLIDCSEIT